MHRRSRLQPDPGRYSSSQRWRNTTLSTDPPEPDPLAEAFRCAVLARDRSCTLPGAFGVACCGHLDVHHVIPRLVAPERKLDVDNGTALCRCHHDCLEDHRFVGAAQRLGVLGRNGDRVVDGRVVR